MKKPQLSGLFRSNKLPMKYHFSMVLVTLMLVTSLQVFAQQGFNVTFYNVENLFDTTDDPEVRDEEFTPEGDKKWTEERYTIKLDKLSRVLSASVEDGLPEVIGLCEVENRGVVEDLMKTGKLKKGKYSIVHQDSPDGRGIDVALAYRKKALKVIDFKAHTVDLPGENARPTRDILHVRTIVAKKDTVHFFINHWPSRYGGEEKSRPKRIQAAEVLREVVDELLEKQPRAKLVIMGDFNDYPDNVSIQETLDAQEAGKTSKPTSLVNLAASIKGEQGSYNYRGNWGMLDQIIVSQSLVSEGSSGMRCTSGSLRIVKEEWMLYTDPKSGAQKPNRTYGGNNYYGGFSDHLPVVVDFKL